MKIVCGWCGADMGEKEGPDKVTHGICKGCAREVEARERVDAKTGGITDRTENTLKSPLRKFE